MIADGVGDVGRDRDAAGRHDGEDHVVELHLLRVLDVLQTGQQPASIRFSSRQEERFGANDARLAAISEHVRTLLGAPHILDVQEVDTLAALQALADRIRTDDATIGYRAYLVEGNDPGGIDTGYLVRDSVEVTSVEAWGRNETWTAPGDDLTRGVLSGLYRIQYSSESSPGWNVSSTPAGITRCCARSISENDWPTLATPDANPNHDDLDPDLREQVHLVLRAAVDLGVALLPAVAADLADGHAVDADRLQGLTDVLPLVRLDDRADQLHDCMLPVPCPKWGRAPPVACRS